MNTEFEKHAREQFDGLEVTVDTDALWANVYPHVKEEKGNRKVFWFFLLGLLVGVTAIGLFNFKQGNNTSANKSTKATTSATSIITEPIGSSDQTDLNNQVTAMSIGTTADDVKTNPSILELTESDFEKVETRLNTASNKDTTASSLTTKTKSISQKKSPSTASSQSNQSNKKDAIASDLYNEKTPITSKETTPLPTNKEAFTQKEKALIAADRKSLTNTLLIQALNASVIDQRDDSKIPESQQKNALDTYVKNLSRLKKATKKLRVGIGVYGGVSKSTSELSTNDTIGVNYTAERNTSEKQLETAHLGLGISVYSNKHLYLRSGVEYTRIASVFSSNSSLTTIDSTWAAKEITVNTITGERDTIFGNVPSITTNEFTKKHYNYIHLIDIPVIIGYQFEYEPWSVGIEGGIYANISAKYTGDISSTASDSFYDLEADEDKWFKTNIGVQPFIGLNAAYNVSDNFQVHFSPGFRFETLFSTDKNPVKEKHASLGIRFGVRYIFD